MKRKKLPIGIQTFAKIREGDHYYVDKTGFALCLIDEGSHYFLSRPRRFGKSLFIDTLGELFAGNEALFRGLYCHDQWDWSVKYPVVRLSFGAGVADGRASLDHRIQGLLRINAEALGICLPEEPDISLRFGELIRRAGAQHGQRVVILVDEYDKPILDNLTRPEVAREMCDGLRNLYSVIKDCDTEIRFVMLTGVSKFSKVSLFPGLNNLKDITVDARYSAICGYTEADLDEVFAPELAGLDRDEIRQWYNGYNWTGEAVYNPFDALPLFDSREFRPYWFETGTPTFLVDLLTERQTFLPRLGQQIASEALLSSFEVGDLSTEALMFQTGYLTIAGVQRIGAQPYYRLCYPNLEVQSSLNEALLRRLSPEPGPAIERTGRLYGLLLANDFAGMRDLFTVFFASIPHEWHRKNPIAQCEGYYASVFYAYFAALGLSIVTEEASHAGRLDMAVRLNGQVYLFEFKVVELEPDGGALAQIKACGYADKYRGGGAPVHMIGAEFSRERRSVVGFEIETLR